MMCVFQTCMSNCPHYILVKGNDLTFNDTPVTIYQAAFRYFIYSKKHTCNVPEGRL